MEVVAERRTVLGEKVAALRGQGLTPASLYGKGLASQALQLAAADLLLLLPTSPRNDIVTLHVAVAARTATLVRVHERLDVSGLAAALPSSIEIDVASWTDPTQVFRARDVLLPVGVTLVSDPDVTMAMLVPIRGAGSEEQPGAESASPNCGDARSVIGSVWGRIA